MANPGCKASSHRYPFVDEHGFTTVGMALSLLIALSLVFSAAQVYRINSLSAQVQDVADATALSAQSQVAEFMVIARICDATVLSLSLTGLVSVGLGTVAACIPPAAGVSKALIEAGRKILKARDAFAERAQKVLGKLQEALPFFAAACAVSVAQANNIMSQGANYVGIAVLVPSKGEPIDVAADNESDELVGEVEEEADEIRQNAKEAEEAAERANRAKERAYMRDCGDAPEYCMYERAGWLAGMSGVDNPLYGSVDTWSFSVALERARSYYAMRLQNEGPADYSVAEQARSALRARFYQYAIEQLEGAYVYETADSFEAYFPYLPSNTSEMRSTSLYTDVSYPVSVLEDGTEVMHAWSGCPKAADVIGWGSIWQLEQGGYEKCEACEFSASSMGSVAAASTSIPNGFEYHYEAVANEARIYQQEREAANEPKKRVKDQVESLFEKLGDIVGKVADKRIKVEPPGRYGAVALVVNTSQTPVGAGFSSSFVKSGSSLGPRVAVAGATLLDEGGDEDATVISSLLDGLSDSGNVFVGAAGIVLSCWSAMLQLYGNGQRALEDAIEGGLNAIPLLGASGLGTWAADTLRDAIEAVGLEPVELGALKPVLVNTAHVAAKGEGELSSKLLQIKAVVVSVPLMSADLLTSLIGAAEDSALERLDGLGDSIEVANIELLGPGGPSIPISIPIPEAVRNVAISTVQNAFDRVRHTYATTTGVRPWD